MSLNALRCFFLQCDGIVSLYSAQLTLTEPQKQQPECFCLAELLNFWMLDSCWIQALLVWYVLSLDFSCISRHKDVCIEKAVEEGSGDGRKTWTDGRKNVFRWRSRYWSRHSTRILRGRIWVWNSVASSRGALIVLLVFTILRIFLLVCRTGILGFSRWPSTLLHITNVDYSVATWAGYMGSQANEPLLLTSHASHNGICL